MVSLLVNRFLLFDKKLHYIALSTHLIYLNLLHMVIYRVIFKIFGNSGQSEQMLVMTDRCTCTGIYPLNISSALCHFKISKKIKYPIFYLSSVQSQLPYWKSTPLSVTFMIQWVVPAISLLMVKVPRFCFPCFLASRHAAESWPIRSSLEQIQIRQRDFSVNSRQRHWRQRQCPRWWQWCLAVVEKAS